MGFAGRELRRGVATKEHVQRGEWVRGRGMGSGREEGKAGWNTVPIALVGVTASILDSVEGRFSVG